MKVSIITILDNTNFGTYLQALATGLVVKSLGHDGELIRYTRPIMTLKGYPKTILKERGILSWMKHRNDIKGIIELRNKDYAFLGCYLPITEEYTSYKALCKNPPVADVYITGSDQVWNSIYNRGVDKSFYLEFAPRQARRIAYAASIGMDDFANEEKPIITSLLRKYAQITVREKSAQQILKKLDIKSEVVLDPTLLLNCNQWNDIAKKNKISFLEKYILIYSVEQKQQDELIAHYAKAIAEQKGLKIYHVSYGGTNKQFSCADKFFGKATPEVFLGLMQGANYVVVSSFHGTAFAINFQKQFLTISANRFNSRLYNLLETTGLQDRQISNKCYDLSSLKDIDYTQINIELDKQRKKSLALIKNMIEL